MNIFLSLLIFVATGFNLPAHAGIDQASACPEGFEFVEIGNLQRSVQPDLQNSENIIVSQSSQYVCRIANAAAAKCGGRTPQYCARLRQCVSAWYCCDCTP
ncbi:MAG: hypothetical protein K2X47_17185 [Bdellovibrionales bacterium]|nr:hypothetical protein [Bdellovibrionales bacterium]